MKRIFFGLCVALITFSVGVSCEWAFQRYLEAGSGAVCLSLPAQPEYIALTDSNSLARPQMRAGDLAVVLQRIDEKFRRQCRMPTDWNGDWATIKQLDSFRNCNDEWATARRDAINAERDLYLVRY